MLLIPALAALIARWLGLLILTFSQVTLVAHTYL